jgi:polyhydroxybutyrate depolymerase
LPAGWVATNHTIRVEGRNRGYLLVRPAAVAGDALPVVVVLHGRGMTPACIERVTRLARVTGPAILVFPAGYGRSWNAGACCGAAHHDGVNDVAFLAAVARQVIADQPDAAAHRVYLVGYSNGGRLAYRVACVDPGTFAGVAAVEAVPVAACAHTDPVPIMMMVASREDPLLTIPQGAPPKVINGYVEPTVAATVETWRKLDGCPAPPTTFSRGDATVTTWLDCRGAARVGFVLYPGGSHAWPEAGPGRPSAQSLVWAFFGGVAPEDDRAPGPGLLHERAG